MITKNVYHIQSLGSTNNATINVNGFLTAIIDINVTELSAPFPFNIYGDVTQPVSEASPRPKIWLDDVLQDGIIHINTIGKHRILIDLTNVKYLNVRHNSFTGTCNLCLTPFPVDKSTDLYMGGHELIYDVQGKKQIDIAINKLYEFTASNNYVRVYKSDDGLTWDNFTSAASPWGITTGNYTDFNGIDKTELYANVEGIKYFKVVLPNARNIYKVVTALHENYVEGREFDLNTRNNQAGSFISTMAPLLKGYRYVKIEFKDTTCSKGYGSISGNAIDGVLPNFLDCKYNELKNMTPLRGAGIYTTDNSKWYISIGGNAIGGGLVLDFWEPLKEGVRFYNIASSGSDINFGTFHISLFNKIPDVDIEKTVAERNDYTIEECGVKNFGASRDVFGVDVLEYTSDKLYFYRHGYEGIKFEIPFNSESVEAFIPDEEIKYAYLLPYNPDGSAVGTFQLFNRIVVFSTKNRILYNLNTTNVADRLCSFSEAKIVNPFKRWIPVKNKSQEDSVHKYFPVLKDYDYNQFESRGASVVQGASVGNLLLDFPTPDDNFSRLTWCNMSRSNKVAIFGNYNNGNSEPFIIGTVDGGKTWKVLVWFAFVTDYPLNSGLGIDLSPLSGQVAYPADSLKICIRKYRVPTEEDKEPADTFIINEEDQINVSSFGVDSDGDTVVNLATGKDLGNYSPICFFKNSKKGNVWDYICNNDLTEDGSGNNGIFFRLKKVSDTQYKLFAATGNPYEASLICFHIHCVNRSTAGFVISTGESYFNKEKCEGGFLYFLPQNYNNGSNFINGGTDSMLNKIFRLSSTPDGVNRACGAYIFNDDIDPTVLYASDESFYTNGKRNASLPGRTVKVNNVPTGIFMGKLSDIDDQSKFRCVCESRSTMISLFEWNGHFGADGHSDAVCLSKDGKTWGIETNTSPHALNGCDAEGNIYFGNCKVKFK